MLALGGIFLSSFVVAFSGAAAPGPVLSLTVAETMRRGFWAGPVIILGHGILEAGLLVFFFLGLSKFLSNPLIPAILGMGGGLFLVSMALAMLRNSFRIPENSGPLREGVQFYHPGDASSSGRLVALGILTSISNPYWFIWWVTVGLAYVHISMGFGAPGVILFFVGHILADLTWYGGISFFISHEAHRIRGRVYKGILVACSLLLLIFGVCFINWSIGQLCSGGLV